MESWTNERLACYALASAQSPSFSVSKLVCSTFIPQMKFAIPGINPNRPENQFYELVSVSLHVVRVTENFELKCPKCWRTRNSWHHSLNAWQSICVIFGGYQRSLQSLHLIAYSKALHNFTLRLGLDFLAACRVSHGFQIMCMQWWCWSNLNQYSGLILVGFWDSTSADLLKQSCN